MVERPTPDLTIVETRVYRGANVWSYDKAIHLVVDLGVLEDFPTNTIPGFTDHLLELLPGLREHSCSRGRRGGFVERLQDFPVDADAVAWGVTRGGGDERLRVGAEPAGGALSSAFGATSVVATVSSGVVAWLGVAARVSAVSTRAAAGGAPGAGSSPRVTWSGIEFRSTLKFQSQKPNTTMTRVPA